MYYFGIKIYVLFVWLNLKDFDFSLLFKFVTAKVIERK